MRSTAVFYYGSRRCTDSTPGRTFTVCFPKRLLRVGTCLEKKGETDKEVRGSTGGRKVGREFTRHRQSKENIFIHFNITVFSICTTSTFLSEIPLFFLNGTINFRHSSSFLPSTSYNGTSPWREERVN